MRKEILIIALLVSLSFAVSIKTDKDVYTCDVFNNNKCDPVKITLTLDKLDTYSLALNWDTKGGAVYTSKLPYLSATDMKTASVTASNLAMTGTQVIYWNTTAYGNVKFNITVYDSKGVPIAKLDPSFISNWQYRKNITINNTAGNRTVWNYPLLLNVTFATGKMNPDFSDLRFTWYNSTDDTYINNSYWIENKVNSVYADVYVNVTRVNKSGYDTIGMYYGNAIAASESNGYKVFTVFDDAETDHLADWLWSGGSWVSPKVEIILNGTNHVLNQTQAGGTQGDMYKNVKLSQNFTISFNMYEPVNSQTGADLFLENVGAQLSGIGAWLRQPSQDTYAQDWLHGIFPACSNETIVNSGQWYNFKITVDGNFTTYKVDNTGKCSGNNVRAENYMGFGGYGVAERWFDNIIIGTIISPAPTTSLGAEEYAIGNYTINSAATAYEMSTTNINITFYNFNTSAYANVYLIYNNTQYPMIQRNESTWNYIVPTPFITAQNTAVSFKMNWTANGTAQESSDNTQTLQYIYNLSATWNSSSVIEGSYALAHLQITNGTGLPTISSAYLTVGGTQLIGSFVNYNGTINYDGLMSVGANTNTSEVKNYVWTTGIYYGGVTRYQNVTSANLTVSQMVVTFCNNATVTALIYKTYDETTWTYLNNSDYSIIVSLRAGTIQRNYSAISNNTMNISICVSPASSSYTADIQLIYSNPIYTQRKWYEYNLPISNATINKQVFLLNSTNSFLTNFLIKDVYGIVTSNAVILIQKYNYTNNRFYNMTNTISDTVGNGFIYLNRYSTPYRIVLTDFTNAILNIYSDYFVNDVPVSLRTTFTTQNYQGYFDAITRNCNYDNNTKVLTCTFNDPNSVITQIDFNVHTSGMWGYQTICNETRYANYSGTFICDLSSVDNATKGYTYSLTVRIIHSPEYAALLYQGFIFRPWPVIYGASGALYAFLIIIFLGFFGVWKPIVGIGLAFFGVVLSYWLGLLDFTTNPMFIVGMLVALFLILAWRLKE